MMSPNPAAGVAEWATKSGSVWARRWRDTDAGLAGLSPHLLAAVKACAPARPFRAFDIGCGPGTTTIDVAAACPDAEIIACDVSPDLAEIAHQRTADLPRIRVVEGDAETLAASEGLFDLFFSRHGVMFFPDPIRAFRSFRNAADPGASIVFSCFQSWEANPWASELASAAAGRELPAPGREPSGFAFADPDYVRGILRTSGWNGAESQDVKFDYVAAGGVSPVEAALGFFTELGPSSRVLESLAEDQREAALQRMRSVIEEHYEGTAVVFPAAAWIWTAKASAS
jgi:SAM-dependent methyltransferase